MSTNISKEKRDELINKINHLKKFTESLEDSTNKDDILNYINELKNSLFEKKYGLVFEEHEENVDRLLANSIPILIEEKDLLINKNKNVNFIIEGDNLASLQILLKTHKERIDCIYIDPPYNTGSKDFKYDDNYLDKEDLFKHSKWLSFMKRRLELAKSLLTNSGMIVISIDENENHSLKLLCDEIFGPQNMVGEFIWKARSGKGGTNSVIAMQHEYVLCYAKNKSSLNFRQDININKKDKKESLRQWGQGVYRKDRATMFFPILFKENRFSLPSEQEVSQLYVNESFDDEYLKTLKEKYVAQGYEFILPIIDSEYGRWRKGFKGVQDLISNGHLIIEGDTSSRSIKKIIPADRETSSAIDSLLLKYGTASTGTSEIKELFNNKKVFDTTKPLNLIKYLLSLQMFNKPDGIVLDFFAGSGTTGHAVLELNQEDEGNRSFILCTNNENNICREVTYKRLEKLIVGYPFKGKKETILFEKKINYTDLKKSNKILMQIEELTKQEEENYNKITTSIKNGLLTTKGITEYTNRTTPFESTLKYFRIDYEPISEKLYYEYADKLLLHIKELVELENGIHFSSNKSIHIILTDEDLESFLSDSNQLEDVRLIYLGHDVLLSSVQEKLIRDQKIKINYIPNYYYKELRGE